MLDKIPVIYLPASKSISNRLLILQALYPEIQIENLSTARDTYLLQNALQSKESLIDVADAGTSMRFLLSYLALKTKQEVILTGTPRMQNRPVAPLVEALRSIGAGITYVRKPGFPPVKIKPAKITGNQVIINSDLSSQFISSLMLIAPALPSGLKIIFDTQKSVSRPYWEMTLQLIRSLGAKVELTRHEVTIHPLKQAVRTHFKVESDWSSTSYFYEAVSLYKKPLFLPDLFPDSLQGDQIVREIFTRFGVHTSFENNGVLLKHSRQTRQEKFHINCRDFPDLAQTLAVTCFALKIECKLTGLQTLRIKETDRIEALQNELTKLKAKVKTGNDFIEIYPPSQIPDKKIEIKTYSDHRMSMSFGILKKIFPEMTIENPSNVQKSFPGFWQALERYFASFNQ